MASLGERVLGAAVRLVRLLTVLAALVVLGLILFAFAQNRSLKSTYSAADAPPTTSAPGAPPRGSAEPLPPLAPLTIEGPTPFVRRLHAGTELAALARDVAEMGEERAHLEERLKRIMPYLLRADLPRSPPRGKYLLGMLTSPPRDIGQLTLAGATEGDPHGTRLRVRAWTLGEPYAADELATASDTLDHIVRSVDRDVVGGIDVLITPGRGDDVFPYQAVPPIKNAAGVYYIADQYCVVDLDLRPAFRVEVVEHELIHAYCRRTSKSFFKSRLVTEGIAEYLRLVTPRDNGLNVPAERLRDSFAELLLLLDELERAGVDLARIQPRRLLELDPDGFYQLGHLAYLTAQAAMAYVGGDVIQLALYRQSDAPIREVIAGLGWQEFLSFLRRGARGGRIGRTVIVDDAAPATYAYRDPTLFAKALRDLGADVPEDLMPPRKSPSEIAAELSAESQVHAVMRLLGAEPAEVRVFVDPSEDMGVLVRFAPPHALAEVLGLKPEGETARQAAVRLAQFFGAALRGHVVALGRSCRTGGADVLDFVQPLALQGFVDYPRAERRLSVLVVGSAGIGSFVPAKLSDPGNQNEVLLVVDLTPDGQGLRWAQAYDVPRRAVAYWAPLAEPE